MASSVPWTHRGGATPSQSIVNKLNKMDGEQREGYLKMIRNTLRKDFGYAFADSMNVDELANALAKVGWTLQDVVRSHT